MLTTRLSSFVFAAVSCWVLLGCLGPRDRDEVSSPANNDTGSGGSGGTANETDTPGPFGSAGSADTPRDAGVAASQNPIPLDGASSAPFPPQNAIGSDLAGYGCAVEVWRSPQTELERYNCSISSQQSYEGSGQAGAGSDSQLKEWLCDCNGASQTVEASECAQALKIGCDVAQNTATTFCRTDGVAIGVCWKKKDKGWQCGCGDPVDRVALVDRDDQECSDALFHACAQRCEGPLGECTPLLETDAVGYQCDCTYYGEIARENAARMCQSALQNACHPNYSNYYESCNGYVGYCDRNDQSYECHCLDGIEQSIAAVEMSEVGCYTALEQSCGINQPPEDRICRIESPDPTSNEQGYCVQISEDFFECGCSVGTNVSTTTLIPPPISPGGVDSGNTIPITITSPPSSEQNELLVASSCEQALLLACPDLIQATPEQKSAACDIASRCYPIVVQDACLERIRDDCAICIVDATDNGAQCGDERLETCLVRCVNLAAPTDEPEECKTRLGYIDLRDANTECLCDRCLESLAPCGVDVGCMEVAVCAYENDCVGTTCLNVASCQQVIEKWMNENSDSVMMAQVLGDCGAAQGCL